MKNIKIFISFLTLCVCSNVLQAQAVDPCDAPQLPVEPGAHCIPQIGSLESPGNIPTTGVPNPGCVTPQLGKWYKITVPDSGKLVITMYRYQTDFASGAMALYAAANCSGPFSLLACSNNGNEAPNHGLMPKITRENLTPGQTVYLRVWRVGGGEGQFTICAQALTCHPQTTDGTPNNCLEGQTAAFCFACDGDDPINNLKYCSGTNSPSIGPYNCLSNTPNPTWFHLKIQQEGALNMKLTQTSDFGALIDVDFAIYGPFDDISNACDSVLDAQKRPLPKSCSFSASAVETVTVAETVADKYYILLVTNYNGSQGTFKMECNPSNTTVSDCSFLCQVDVEAIADTCSQGIGRINVVKIQGDTITDLVSDPLLDITWEDVNGTAIDIPDPSELYALPGLYPGTYTVTASTSVCKNGKATVVIEDVSPDFSASYTKVSCPNGTDGTATAYVEGIDMTDVTVTYLWDDPLAQTTQTATNLPAGTYSCEITLSIGCTGIATVTVDEIPEMIASFIDSSDVTCYTKNDGMFKVAVSQGTEPYTYSWDNSTSTENIANDLYVGTHKVTITDDKGCITTVAGTLSEPDPLQITFISNDTLVCPETSLPISAQGIGGSTPYIYTWTIGTDVVGVGQTITVKLTHDHTVYCVKLSEECGSPSVDSCLNVVIPEPVPPILIADKYEECKPGVFHIENVSSNISELASTYINFGNHTEGTILNGGDTTVVYNSVGIFDLTVTNTSIYGCQYTTVFQDFFKVNPNPISNFYVAGNPTTIFETTLQAHQLASNDVVKWEWISPYSEPEYSNSENPIFSFPNGVISRYPITLIVTSYFGCVDTMSLDVIVEDAILFYVPNTFTPDDDPYNQSWRFVMQGGETSSFELEVLDRWGKLIWKTNEPTKGWDGRLENGEMAKAGTYVWRARVKHKNDDGYNEYNGIVNLLK